MAQDARQGLNDCFGGVYRMTEAGRKHHYIMQKIADYQKNGANYHITSASIL
jgi:hypothetical protein